MASKNNLYMFSSITFAIMLVKLFVMVRQSVAIGSNIAQSLKKSNDLLKCENGLGVKCGDGIYQNVFEIGNEVSKECCDRLLSVGKDCHDLLTEITIVYKRFTMKEAREIWHKNDKVWEQCENIGSAPNPEKSNQLLKCENGLGKKCGHSIYHHVFEFGKDISEECCSRLKNVGKDCHDLLTEVTIVYKRLSMKRAKEVWKQNDIAWEECNTVE
ncbi:hypothetical protein RND81_02G185800 [Saponaria officinalis]|uniref:Prolamin-like domain-containing protein n=1 Tax=Saponaria officinalis TaxID=3572 RepID=A0AAW1MX73_SAPOF